MVESMFQVPRHPPLVRPALLLLLCVVLPTPAPVALPAPRRSVADSQASPGPRNAHAAVYDLRAGALVLFGGATAAEVRGDTWRWKHGEWHRLPGEGLDPRTFPAMAYDSARDEVVLFGGNRVLFGDSLRPPAMLGDTWLLRGDVWTRVSAKGPSPRAESAMAHDARRGRAVLFGGRDLLPDGRTRRLGDTWEWDGTRWLRLSDSGPTPRSGAAMAYAPEAGGVVLFGGSGGPLGDTWRWDGSAWTRLPVSPAPGRFNTAMARDPSSGRLLRTGGWDGERRVSDTWELREDGWVRIDSGGPAARNHAVLVSAPDRGSVLLHGGHDGDRVFDDLWERRGGRWRVLEAAEPVARLPNGH